MAWTTYHDGLLQEMIALMTEPSWYSQTDITDRLEIIRTELENAGASLEDAYDIQSLISEYDTARLQATDANEARYLTATNVAGATVDELTVMSFPQIARHMYLAHWSPIQDDFEALQEVQATRSQEVFDQWTTIKTTYDSAMGELQSAWRSVFDDQSIDDQEVVDEWADVWASLKERLDTLGAQTRADVHETFDTRLATFQQTLIDRGLYNTSLYAAMLAGNDRARSAELRRHDDSLTDRELQVYQAVLSAQVDALVRKMQNRLQIRGQELGVESLRAEGVRAALSAQAETLAAKIKDQLQIDLGTLAHRFQSAVQLQSVYQKTLETVISRNDVAPSLADLVNLVLQSGRGAGTTLPLDALSPLTTFAMISGQEKE